MAKLDAARSGTFPIGGDLTVHRLGFGGMRLTGPGIWGPPKDPEECEQVLAALPELGVDFLDTADSYGPFVSEDLIGKVLSKKRSVVIATKGGFARHGPDIWVPLGRPEYLRQCVLMSLRRLKRDQIDLWQLHRIDPKVPRDEQFGVMAEMQREGLTRHLGLSEVNVEQIKAASRFFRVATVQNLYNVANRASEAVVQHCTEQHIGFIPWYPLAAGELTRKGGPLDTISKKLEATPSQVALAWVLRRSPVMLPIPGTSRLAHLEENVAAAALDLTEPDFATLSRAGNS